MVVTVKLNSCICFLSGGKSCTEDLEIKEGARIKDIIDHYDIQSEYISLTSINKRIVNENTLLKQNDLVEIFPIFGGG